MTRQAPQQQEHQKIGTKSAACDLINVSFQTMYSASYDVSRRRLAGNIVNWLRAHPDAADTLLGREPHVCPTASEPVKSVPAVWATRPKWGKKTVLHLTEADAVEHAQRQTGKVDQPVRILAREGDAWVLRKWIH